MQDQDMLSAEIVIQEVKLHLESSQLDSIPYRLVGNYRVVKKPWSTLYFFSLENTQEHYDFVAKIVRFPDQRAPYVSWTSQELIRYGKREYLTMQKTALHFNKKENENLYTIAPRAYIPKYNIIVMDYIKGKSLYDDVYNPVKLFTKLGRSRSKYLFRQTGKWINWFHSLKVDLVPKEGAFLPQDNLHDLRQSIKTLESMGHDFFKLNQFQKALMKIENLNCDKQVWTHGDFHLRNVMVLPNLGIAGIDIALERLDSPYYDISRFIGDIKTRRITMVSRGLLPPLKFRTEIINSFLEGYFDKEIINYACILLYEGNYILNKWLYISKKLDEIFSDNAKLIKLFIKNYIVNPFFFQLLQNWVQEIISL